MEISCFRERTCLVRGSHRDAHEPALEFYAKVDVCIIKSIRNISIIFFIMMIHRIGINIASARVKG